MYYNTKVLLCGHCVEAARYHGGGHYGKCTIRQIMTYAIIMNGRKDRAEIEIVSITLVKCSKITKCQTEPNML